MNRSRLLLMSLSAFALLWIANARSLARAKDRDTAPKHGPVASVEGRASAREPGKTASTGPRASASKTTGAPANKTAAASPVPGTARTGGPPAGSTTKLRAKPNAAKPCYARPVQLVRARGNQVEPYELSLTMCNGTPNRAVLDTLSILARPRDVERPTPAELRAYRALPVANAKAKRTPKSANKKYRDPQFVAEHIMRLNPGLLLRLQRVANRYRGKAIEVVSGYRPDSRETSRHHQGRALDLRVVGIARERLRDFLRRFDQTGVGYYPNSYFVHMDVRDVKAYWIDRSGPGEPADYGPWPTPRKQIDRSHERIVKGALADLAGPDGDGRTAMVHASTKRDAHP